MTGQNRSAWTDCVTCKGNQYVVVGHRKPTVSAWALEYGITPKPHPKDRGIEEVTRCPACNWSEWWRNKDWSYGPEPGEVVVS